jgi:pimeloyl-ACP methyl ester carboxylesterase
MILRVNRFLFLFIVVLFQFLAGCKKDDVTPVVKSQNEVLISSEKFVAFTAADLRASLAAIPLSSLLVNDVVLYKITYTTRYKNQDITASGLVGLPKTTGAVPMVSFQHGTIASHSEAPSALALNSTELTVYAGLASLGFIAVAPDLIGFGSSSSLLHPYYVEEATASAVIDMIKAAKELAADQYINFNSKLFLAGYSQGGYSTMAAHKAIEQNGLTGFNLIASFPAAGGYDVKAMQEYFFGLTTYNEPFYIAYVAMAYKTQYDTWTQPLSDFFNEPYASRIPGLFDGSKNGSQINAGLTTSIPDFIRADLKANINTDARYKYITDAFNENSLTDWKPAIRMMMYHGDADVTVPYNNSVITYQKLIAHGASPSILTLTTLPGATHGTGVLPYIEDFIPKMIQLK